MVTALNSARNTLSQVCNLLELLSEKQFYYIFYNFIKILVLYYVLEQFILFVSIPLSL